MLPPSKAITMASFKGKYGKYAPPPRERLYQSMLFKGKKFERRAEKMGEIGKEQEERGHVKWKMDVKSV
jgi:hypothetical protein